MNWLILSLLPLALADSPAASGTDAARLTELVLAIQRADFRGERDVLRRLAGGLDGVTASQLGAYRAYWRGFALWRSAINGGNETPMPSDVRTDLEAAILAFREASEQSPAWIEPRIGLVFCWVGLSYAPGADPTQLPFAREEFQAAAAEIREKGDVNPRALWFVGGSQLFAPPERGGDSSRAIETYRRALQAARIEARARSGSDVPAWIPVWGTAENLMSLAYLYSNSALKDRALAQAYADGALALEPDWHYVSEILVPQIQALPTQP